MHDTYTYLYQPDKLVVAMYSINEGHCTNFKDIMVLDRTYYSIT